MKEEKLLKARELRKVVEEVFGLDIMLKNRSRQRVDARIVYAKILREHGYTFPQIGSLLVKDHSTIIHYCSMFDEAIDFIPELKKKYRLCRDMFRGEASAEHLYTKDELINELIKTKQELSLLHLKYEELKNYKHQRDMEEQKWGGIYKLIRERTPRDMEDVVERRINAMFNTSYDYQET
jgi:hypothetical protein